MIIPPNSALIVVDMQNDFVTGSLAIKDAWQIIKPVNELIFRFTSLHFPVFYTRDWHVEKHPSFTEQGGKWPPHCIMDSVGAEFLPGLCPPLAGYDHHVISKGVLEEAYSGFHGTALNRLLTQRNVSTLFVCGLATDYCVKETALDGRKESYQVSVVQDAVRGVEENTTKAAIQNMIYGGVRFVDGI